MRFFRAARLERAIRAALALNDVEVERMRKLLSEAVDRQRPRSSGRTDPWAATAPGTTNAIIWAESVDSPRSEV